MYFGFRDINVDYGKKKVLSGLSLEVPKGKIMTLIGQNGCGKSTLLKVIPRAVTPKSGFCELDGKPIREYKSKLLAKRIAYLAQVHTSPPDIDVRTLVSYGRYPHMKPGRGLTKADGEVIDRVIGMTGLEKLSEQPLSTLSGGERQRISIARAFLKDAPIILMDEATASLDVDNESAIQESISKLIRDKTVLIIAHRMRTVDGVDRIVVLKGGTVAEQGTPKQLKAQNGIYRHMVDLQLASEQWKYC